MGIRFILTKTKHSKTHTIQNDHVHELLIGHKKHLAILFR